MYIDPWNIQYISAVYQSDIPYSKQLGQINGINIELNCYLSL